MQPIILTLKARSQVAKQSILPLLIILLTVVILLPLSITTFANNSDLPEKTLRIATFNVSMEALNYQQHDDDKTQDDNALDNKKKVRVSGNELFNALKSDHQQIKNIAQIIQTVNPDIILLNEFDRTDSAHRALHYFIEHYLNKPQGEQAAIHYPYFYHNNVNTGDVSPHDLNHDGKSAVLPNDGYGFGYFPGHYAMVLLSKYPLEKNNIRTFQHFKWHDMPNALAPKDPTTGKMWYNNNVWQDLRLSSKSHWDIPVNINGKILHILASHPTPPVFDGEEDRNGKRNHDELRFWQDYLSPNNASYIYDDNKKYGGLADNQAFVILGDLNADAIDGNAIKKGIANLIQHPRVTDTKPESEGGKQNRPDNPNAKYHTAAWGMRADYVLVAKQQTTVINSGIFWPTLNNKNYKLVQERKTSSDHRLVWADIKLH